MATTKMVEAVFPQGDIYSLGGSRRGGLQGSRVVLRFDIVGGPAAVIGRELEVTLTADQADEVAGLCSRYAASLREEDAQVAN